MRRGTGSCIRGSATPGRSSGAARRRSICRRPRSSPSLENHDQVANSAFGQRLHQLASPGAASRDDRAAAARARDADAVPGAGVQRVGAVPVLRRPASRSCTSRSATDGASSWRSSPASAIPRSCAGFPRRSTADTFQRSKLDPAERERHAEALALHPDLIALRRTDPVIGAAGAADRRRGAGSGGAGSALLRRRAGDRLLIVNLGPRPRARCRRPSRCSRRRRTPTGSWSGAVKRPVRRTGHAGDRIRPRERRLPGESRCPLRSVLARSRDDHQRRYAARSSSRKIDDPHEPMPRREWLVTNGLGGYASGTVAGVVTRRYHGLLVAALPAPLGRIVMLNHLLERVRFAVERRMWLGDEDEVAGPERRRPHRPPRRVPARARACRSGATRSAGSRSRSGC